jgi:hypothetical protein
MFSGISRNTIIQTVKKERMYAFSVIASIIGVNGITNI